VADADHGGPARHAPPEPCLHHVRRRTLLLNAHEACGEARYLEMAASGGGLHSRRVDFTEGDSDGVAELSFTGVALQDFTTRIFWAPRCSAAWRLTAG